MSILEGLNPPALTLSQSFRVSESSFSYNDTSKLELEMGDIQQNILPPTCVKDIICNQPSIYRFACFTGIIQPDVSNDEIHKLGCIKLKFRPWVLYLHFALFANTILLVLYGGWIFKNHKDRNNSITIISQSFGYVLQNILLYPGIIYLRRELSVKRDIDTKIYEESFKYAINIGRKVLLGLTILLIILVAFECSFVSTTNPGLLIILALILFFLFIPSNFFLTGLVTFLIMEQRVSFHTMEQVRQELEAKSLTHQKYFEYRSSIDERDKVSPINWLIFAALIGNIIAIIMIFMLREYVKSDIGLIFEEIFYIISGYGRQTIVLIMFLAEVGKVNELADIMVHRLAKIEWIGSEIKRINVFIAMKECPMGSSVFYYRPSKFNLFIQIGSALVGIALAVFWAIVFA